MARKASYMFLVDNINAQSAETLRKALLADSTVSDVSVKLNSGVVSVTSTRDPETTLKMACSIAGCIFRMKVNKKKALYWS